WWWWVYGPVRVIVDSYHPRQLVLRSAETSSCLRMVERPLMFLARALSSNCCLVWSSSEAEREPALRVAAACLAESLRSAALAFSDFFCPEPPLRLPPPDCLLTVAQARDSASSFGTPLRS